MLRKLFTVGLVLTLPADLHTQIKYPTPEPRQVLSSTQDSLPPSFRADSVVPDSGGVMGYRIEDDEDYQVDRDAPWQDSVYLVSGAARIGRMMLEEDPITDEDRGARLLGLGQISYAGKPELGVDVLQLFIAPDIAGWNVLFPVILSTSAPSFSEELSRAEAAADLLKLSSGMGNLAVSYHTDWRGRTDSGEPSLTGLYLDVGNVAKINFASAEGTSRQAYFLTSPMAALELRMTTKNNRDAESYSGVIHARVEVGGTFFLSEADVLARVFEVDEVNDFQFLNISVGFFPRDGASINLLNFSTSRGNDIGELRRTIGVGLSLYPGSL